MNLIQKIATGNPRKSYKQFESGIPAYVERNSIRGYGSSKTASLIEKVAIDTPAKLEAYKKYLRENPGSLTGKSLPSMTGVPVKKKKGVGGVISGALRAIVRKKAKV